MDRLDDMSEYSLLQVQKRQQGPYPRANLKHADKPATVITDTIQRIDLCYPLLLQKFCQNCGTNMKFFIRKGEPATNEQ
jgi:hypothetical protein